MNSKNKVGVCIPVKKGLTAQEKVWFSNCQESIQNQTHQNLNLYIEHDKGIAENINKAANRAVADNCDFIFVMSADDWLENNCITKALEVYNLNRTVGFVTCSIKYHPHGHIHIVKQNVTYQDQLKRNQMVGFALYPVQVWHEFGGYSTHYSDIAKASLEDYDLQTRIMKYYNYAVLKEPLVNYRIHQNQTTHKLNNQQSRLNERFDNLNNYNVQ